MKLIEPLVGILQTSRSETKTAKVERAYKRIMAGLLENKQLSGEDLLVVANLLVNSEMTGRRKTQDMEGLVGSSVYDSFKSPIYHYIVARIGE